MKKKFIIYEDKILKMFKFLHVKRNRYLFFCRFKTSKINLRRVKKRENA